jgi:tetratricopeptide (TPR) repeat protein
MVEWVALGLKHGRTAVNLDPLNATAHILYGLALNNSGDNELALKESARAVALNSSDAIAQGLRGGILAYSGRAAEALPHLAQAIRLSPIDPLRWLWLFHTSMAHYFLHDYEACAASGRELCRILPDAFIGYRVLLTALAELDHYDEAHHCADLIYARFPDEMTALLSTRWPQWRESDYSAHVASIAKGGLVMRNGKLFRIDRC